ncbi:M13 family metallopeptidase [Corynebacterium bovis]|uniref:Peptidase M13 n=1 Tax=Corynebacterium bovis TaxID=36808 RepID=A0A426Q388_9CORY|nr:M13-type metalloendopeptidase [Corynebacterium bovis]RRO91547.1 peptidase M13 [Corynebacterium bovis]RRO94304.1 peptidase M13 [Corynebacterium bovis]RRO96264.1 peptidase M13 [Corynebacterium bovis]RRO99510.1 peptidase M13 [Corynebacterium bovis]RRQ03042.1 peptidase M13 [Corynebacterium bovis]
MSDTAASTPPAGTDLPDDITEAATGPVPGPAEDLYRHVNGDWIATHAIPADRGVDGTFHQLRDRAEADVRAIVEAADPDTRIGALYRSFMDTEGIDAAGPEVLEEDLAGVRGATDMTAFARALGELDVHGVGGVVGFWVEKDSGSDVERAYIVQSGLGLPDEAYYRQDQHAETRVAYRELIRDMFDLAEDLPRPGRWASATSGDAADAVVAFETALASGHWDNVASRDAEKTYNLTDPADLPTGFPFVEWLRAVRIDPDSEGGRRVVVSQPSYLEHVATMATDGSHDLDTWKLWAYWHVLRSRAGLLPERFGQRTFDFYGRTLMGSTEQRARWKRALGLIEGQVGEDVGRVFVDEHFPPAHKERMEELVRHLLEAYEERISSLPWMTPATRDRALEKLSLFRAKIGYPERWRDFSGLEFGPGGADLVANVRRGSEFNHAHEVGKLGRPSDGELWFTTPQTVNAFYNPVKNDITFPAAILRPPFFDPEADMAGNFGAIGAVIGHEIGHGFDDQGSKYDGHGNLNSWWTDEDREAFSALTDRLVEQYDGLVPTGLAQRGITEHRVNGRFTLGENIGDLGGLGIAVVALRRYLAEQGETVESAPTAPVEGLDGDFTALQRLFLRWARVWQTAIRPQMSAQYVSVDPHSPAEFRCNVVCRNVAEFHEAFDVHEGDGMWLDEADRVRIW